MSPPVIVRVPSVICVVVIESTVISAKVLVPVECKSPKNELPTEKKFVALISTQLISFALISFATTSFALISFALISPV